MTPLFAHHPTHRARVAYALGDANARDRAAVAAHLMGCASCRAEAETIASIHREARSLDEVSLASPAPTHVLDRVLTERAAGVRMLVPPPTARRARERPRWLVAGAAAAALLIAFSVRPAPEGAAPTFPESAAGLFGPTLAFAQEGISMEPSPLDSVRIASLRTATAEYRLQWFDPAGKKSASSRIVERVVVPPGAGAPMVIVRTIPRQAGVLVESLFVDRRSLVPQLQTQRWSRYRVVESVDGGILARSFPARDAAGAIVTRTKSRAVPRAVAGRPFLLAPAIALPLYLRAAVISRGSRIAVVELGPGGSDGDSLTARAGTLVARVVGEDRVTTPAGTFDTWRLELDHTPRDVRQLLWLEKGSQVLVQARRLVRGTRSMETVLDRRTP